MERYKVRITRENFMEFMDYYNADKKRVQVLFDQLDSELKPFNKDMYETAQEMFNRHFIAMSEQKDTFSLKNHNSRNLQLLVNYCADNDVLWNSELVTEHYVYVCFSGNHMVWDRRFCTMVPQTDYDSLSIGEIKGILGSGMDTTFLPAEMNALSVNSVKEERANVLSKEKELEKMKEDIRYARTEELAKIEAEIQKMQDALKARKDELMAEVSEKMAEMKEQVRKMETNIYMLESEIYAVRSYSGETLELRKVRDGKKAVPDTPLVINQKMMYLDEDLARIISIYQEEISEKYTMFEDAAKYSDDVFESFCPQERCITFFRLSKKASYRTYNADRRMYENEELIHGKKIGFILRDGKCAYMGWLDESWTNIMSKEPTPVTFTDNLIYQPGQTDIHEMESDNPNLEGDSRNSMLSRVFAMSVVQGILDNKKLLEFPEKVKVSKPGRYIVYNFATGWIMDDRFGDFATLVDNLNKRTKVKDQILVCYNKWHCDGRGEADRTHDCEVPEGLNSVNYLESDDYGRCCIYVSAKKSCSRCGATANVRVRQNEYINITYMNSIWLSYYVQTKKLGAYCEDYAKMIKHFKRAIQALKEREAEEMSYIRKYYPKADQIPEWEIKLSHWKLNHGIRFINDFQAKRIAGYLQKGEYEETRNLFTKEEFYTIEATNKNQYSYTQFGHVFNIDRARNTGEFATGSDYYMQNYYISLPHTGWYLDEEKKEENRLKIAEELPKLEATVSDRILNDEKKLVLVNNHVTKFMEEHNVSVRDLPECPHGLSFADNRLDFIRMDALEKEDRNGFFAHADKAGTYPDYILKSSCWQVAYYDYVHHQYDKLLHEIKLFLHKRFMDEVIMV